MIALWSMVKVHGLMVADPCLEPELKQILGSRTNEPPGDSEGKFNVVHVQPGYLARPATEAPETQFYFITHRSGAFPVRRVRTVVQRRTGKSVDCE